MRPEGKVIAITLEEKVILTRMQIIIQEDLPMQILHQAEVQIVCKEAVHRDHLLQVHHQEAVQEAVQEGEIKIF